MPLATSSSMLTKARKERYGIPGLLAGNAEMVAGCIRAAEEMDSPLILAFNAGVTPDIPPEMGIPLAVGAAKRAKVPVSVMLDHGHNLEEVLQAIELGASSVMFDGSALPYEENVRQTSEVVRVAHAHAAGVCVEAELGSIAGSAVEVGLPEDMQPESIFTDPGAAADFAARTGVDVLAVSFGNAHGVYKKDKGEPRLDLERVQRIYSAVEIPLAMHGASGLGEEEYPKIVGSGISKVCYYTAMGLGVVEELRGMLASTERGSVVYHHVIARAFDFFRRDTRRLVELLGCAGMASGVA